MIYNQAANAISNSGMSDAELTAFNQKFTKYEGNQKGSTIRTLVQEVMSNNNSDQASDETRVAINTNITIGTTTFSKKGNAPVTLAGTVSAQPNYTVGANTLSNTKTYTVSFQYYQGRVVLIDISNNT
jgi:hypothetical protein